MKIQSQKYTSSFRPYLGPQTSTSLRSVQKPFQISVVPLKLVYSAFPCVPITKFRVLTFSGLSETSLLPPALYFLLLLPLLDSDKMYLICLPKRLLEVLHKATCGRGELTLANTPQIMTRTSRN